MSCDGLTVAGGPIGMGQQQPNGSSVNLVMSPGGQGTQVRNIFSRNACQSENASRLCFLKITCSCLASLSRASCIPRCDIFDQCKISQQSQQSQIRAPITLMPRSKTSNTLPSDLRTTLQQQGGDDSGLWDMFWFLRCGPCGSGLVNPTKQIHR